MNFWPRYVGDMQRKTGHLSCAEMGAYDRLLDHVYSTEEALPGDFEACCRIARAMDKHERKAVESVLRQFFSLESGLYVNSRASEEIEKAKPKIESARANGLKGGRPRRTEEKPNGLPTGLPRGTHDEPKSKALQNQSSSSLRSEEPPLPPTADAGGFEDRSEVKPTAAGLVCRAMRTAGIADVNPGHPRLLALLDAGATEAEFVGFASSAIAKGAGFAWILGAVEGERKRAASGAEKLHRGPLPIAPQQVAANAAASADETAKLLRKEREHAAKAGPAPAHIRDALSRLRSVS